MWTIVALAGGIMDDYICFTFSQMYNIFFSEHPPMTYPVRKYPPIPPKKAFWPCFLVLPFTATGVKYIFGVEDTAHQESTVYRLGMRDRAGVVGFLEADHPTQAAGEAAPLES